MELVKKWGWEFYPPSHGILLYLWKEIRIYVYDRKNNYTFYRGPKHIFMRPFSQKKDLIKMWGMCRHMLRLSGICHTSNIVWWRIIQTFLGKIRPSYLPGHVSSMSNYKQVWSQEIRCWFGVHFCTHGSVYSKRKAIRWSCLHKL